MARQSRGDRVGNMMRRVHLRTATLRRGAGAVSAVVEQAWTLAPAAAQVRPGGSRDEHPQHNPSSVASGHRGRAGLIQDVPPHANDGCNRSRPVCVPYAVGTITARRWRAGSMGEFATMRAAGCECGASHALATTSGSHLSWSTKVPAWTQHRDARFNSSDFLRRVEPFEKHILRIPRASAEAGTLNHGAFTEWCWAIPFAPDEPPWCTSTYTLATLSEK